MKTTVEHYVTLWNSNDASNLENIFNADSEYWDSTQKGGAIEVLTNAISATHEAFSDVSFQIISLETSSDNQLYLEWQMTGTNTGAFFGHPPTGKKINITGLDLIRFESNKIAMLKSFYDSSLFGHQLGLQ